MKNKKYIIIISIIIIIMLLIGIIIIKDDSIIKNPTQIPNKQEALDKPSQGDIEDNTDLENDKNEITEEKVDDMIEYMNSGDSIGIVKSKVTTITNEDGTRTFINHEYIVSEVDLVNKKDKTIDYLPNSPTHEQSKNFKEVFGVDYKNFEKPFDLITSIMNFYNFNTDLSNAEFDNIMFQITEQRDYILEVNDVLIEKIITNKDYDEIIDVCCNYTVEKSFNYNDYISSIRMKVQYKKGSEVILDEIQYVFKTWNTQDEEIDFY